MRAMHPTWIQLRAMHPPTIQVGYASYHLTESYASYHVTECYESYHHTTESNASYQELVSAHMLLHGPTCSYHPTESYMHPTCTMPTESYASDHPTES